MNFNMNILFHFSKETFFSFQDTKFHWHVSIIIKNIIFVCVLRGKIIGLMYVIKDKRIGNLCFLDVTISQVISQVWLIFYT